MPGERRAAVPQPSQPGSRPGCRHLVEHARRASRFYADHYRAVPSGPIRLEELDRLPAVTKPELMARFDDWVTDPAVTRAGVEEFVANLDNLGRDFLGRYVVFTTSGSTGVPALWCRIGAQWPS